MIEQPTLIIHTTYFPAASSGHADPEREAAVRLGEDLYEILTRPRADPLTWGPGIPVRVATKWERIDCEEAKYVVVIPVLGPAAFVDEVARGRALAAITRWEKLKPGTLVLPVPVSGRWRTLESKTPKPLLTELYGKDDLRRATLNEILLAVARVLACDEQYACRLFISHAKIARTSLDPSDDSRVAGV